jgi:glyoxylase-like metal-dependent hydrolase (beta-lactamase superfamily II)
MRLNDDVHVLELSTLFGGRPLPVNLSLVVDAVRGPTLVDTGGPGQEEAIAGAMAEAGVGIADLRRIILTHQHLDHVGSLHALGTRQRRPRAGARGRGAVHRRQPAAGVRPA